MTEETQEKLLSEVIKMIMDSAAEGEYPTEFYSKFYLIRKSISVNTDKLTEEAKRHHKIISQIKELSNSEGQVSNPVFIVIGYRYANKEKHSYPVGVYHSDAQAIDVAEKQTDYRGGKYSFSVYRTFIGTYDLDGDNYCEEIYASKIPQHYIDGTTQPLPKETDAVEFLEWILEDEWEISDSMLVLFHPNYGYKDPTELYNLFLNKK